MTSFVLSILSGVLGNVGSDVARQRIRGLLARTARVAPPNRPPARQTPPPRVELSAPVTYGPPVPLRGSTALSGTGLASALSQRPAIAAELARRPRR